jgi:RNA polymerase sigma-70 factor (ECF subfamily)
MSSKPGQAKNSDVRATADVTLPLVARVLAGDTRAFEEIVRLHEAYVYRTCLAITGNAEDAEDAMQGAFLKAYRHLIQFRGEARFTTWLTRIAVNEALQQLRKHKSTVSLDELGETDEASMPRQVQDWGPNPEELYATEEMRQIVEEAIWALPVAYRIVFVLRDVCDQTTVETAEILNLSIPAVKSRLLRARLMVRESLARRFRKSSTLVARILRTGTMIRTLAERFCRAIGLWGKT